MEINLVPGSNGQNCPGNPSECDECEHLICCTNALGLCDECRAEHGGCSLEQCAGNG